MPGQGNRRRKSNQFHGIPDFPAGGLFECLVDLNTMVKRPIVNTRDEPHADYGKYRRLHVIVGDVNMAELSTYLKVGTLGIVLDLLEAGIDVPQIELDDPVLGIKQVSRDLDHEGHVEAGGRPSDDRRGDPTDVSESGHGFLRLS